MAIKKEEIATVNFGKKTHKDVYIVYSNGTYLRRYDRSLYAQDQIDTGIVSAFSNYLRLNMLSKCSDQQRSALAELFWKHPPAPEK